MQLVFSSLNSKNQPRTKAELKDLLVTPQQRAFILVHIKNLTIASDLGAAFMLPPQGGSDPEFETA